MRIVTVLKSGGEFKPSHVQALQRQCAEHLPGADFVCLSDVDVPGVECWALLNKLPGWWSKMEMFAPDVHGDILYMDLDTVLLGAPDFVIHRDGSPMILRDFYRADGLQSSCMFLPEQCRAEIYNAFAGNPIYHMQRLVQRGDQGFLEQYWLDNAIRFQDIAPGQFVSWKVDCRNGVPPGARVIIFHGRPRPWAVKEFAHLY